MRLLFQLHGSGIGGNETLLHELLQYLRFNDHICFVAASHPCALDYLKSVAFETLLSSDETSWEKLVQEVNPDAVVAIHGDIFALGQACQKLSIPLVWMLGHPLSLMPNHLEMGCLASLLFDQVVIQSRFLQSDLPPFLAKNSQVIFNGINCERFSPQTLSQREKIRAKLGFASTDWIIGYSARLRTYKQHQKLVDAFEVLRQTLPQAKLLLLTGKESLSEKSELDSLGSQLGVTAVSVFPQSMPEVLGAVDVFAFTAEREGLGCALLEAMAMEIPVVAYASGGPQEILESSGLGWLTDSLDPQQLSQTLQNAHSAMKQDQNLGKKSREWVKSKYNIEKMCRQYEELLVSLSLKRKANSEFSRDHNHSAGAKSSTLLA